MKRKAVLNQPQLVRVIRDTRDASLDYFLPAEEARRLLDEGKFSRVNCYANRWDYFEEPHS